MIAHGAIVAVAAFLAIEAIAPGRARIGADLARPSLGAVALPINGVTRTTILTLARGLALGTMSPWWAWLITPIMGESRKKRCKSFCSKILILYFIFFP